MLHSFALITWLVTGVLLIVTVLLHSPKGDGMGGMAVGAAAGMFSSTRSVENTLNRATWTLVTIFLLLAVLLSAGWLQLGAQQGGVAPVIAPDTSAEAEPVDMDMASPTAPAEAPAP
ncbi:MAG: preprotein translocase subunit SecG [Synechococcus sp. SB0662_bin_45]|nr:preprotein translocase subunit SecG [Synechococcus sp. SB0668_bin_13]MYE21783.1 preprotein translocase subunit SecG [Synechococcus sp. SB0662_bin_45]